MAQQKQQPQMVGGLYPPPAVGINEVNNLGYPAYFGQVRPLKYAQKAAKGLGSIQMTIGLICLIFNIIIIGVNSNTYGPYNRYNYGAYICGYGIWGGVMFFIPGLLSVLSGRGTPQKCLIIATMVMDIIAACLTAVVLSLAIIDAVLARSYYYNSNSYYYYYNDTSYRTTTPYYNYVNKSETTVALSAIMAILALVEAVISIIGSAFCCRAVCCTGSDARIITAPYVFTNHQVFPSCPGYLAPSGVTLYLQPHAPTSAPPYNPESYDNTAVQRYAIP